jgi:AcrR family transcriptional regulator
MNERREQILTAAVALWQEHGDGFTMDELAARGEVPRATLYRLFSRKSEVIKALAQERGITECALEPLDISQRILAATRSEFLKSGVQVTLEQIAKVSGIGVATIYRRYKDKNRLFRAAAEDQPLQKLIQAIKPDPEQDPVPQLTTLVEQMLDTSREYGPAMLVMLHDVMSHPELTRYFLERQDRTHQSLATYLSLLMERGFLQKQPPEDYAITLISLCFFASYLGPALKMSEYKGPKHHAAFIVSLFLDGARTRT